MVLYRKGYVRDPNTETLKGSRPSTQPMNEKRLSVEELIAAYNEEKDSDVVKRLMLVILVERDEMQRTKAALSLGRARSWGVKWYGRYLREGLPGLRTRPRPGRPPFVSKKVIKKVWRMAKKTTCWTAKGMLDLIKTLSGVEYEISHVRALLRGRGYTMKVPVGRHVRRASRQKIAGFQRRMSRLIPEKGADGAHQVRPGRGHRGGRRQGPQGCLHSQGGSAPSTPTRDPTPERSSSG